MSRADRVAELIKKEVSDIISRKMNDPRIGFASITHVDIGNDLERATIYVSVFGSDKEKRDTIEGLKSATGFVRGLLGHRLDLREVPEVVFKSDDSLEKGSRVFEIINKLHEEEANRSRTPLKKKAKKKK